MGILSTHISTVGLVGVKPRIIYIETDDDVATVTTAGYLNSIRLQLRTTDVACMSTKVNKSDLNSTTAFYSINYTSGNWIAVSSAASGTVSAGNANELAYYAATGSTVSGITGANGGVLVTSAAGVPSWLANPSVTGKVLSSVNGDAPVWTTPTYPVVVGAAGTFLRSDGANWVASSSTIPDTFAQYDMIYASSANTLTALTAETGATLASDSSKIPTWVNNPADANRVYLSQNGDVPVWSTASYPAVATSAGTIMRADGTDWAASTATFADTYGASELLYSNGANTVQGLTTANNGVLVTSGAGVPSISSTLPAAVQGNITAVGTVASGTWNGDVIALAYGGTSKNLTADNGGIVYTDADSMEVLAATATANQVLLSGSNAAPSWSTATYPATASSAGTVLRANGTNWAASTSTFADTYGANTILYASGANTVTGLAAGTNAVLTANASNVPTWVALTDGEVLIGSAAGAPAASTITAGTGVSIANGNNSITISNSAVSGGGLVWSAIGGTSQSAAAGNGYISDNAAQTTVTLPATAAVGDVVAVQGLGAGSWVLTAAAGDTIQVGSSATSAGGTVTSANQWDAIEVVCVVANTTWATRFVLSAGVTVA